MRVFLVLIGLGLLVYNREVQGAFMSSDPFLRWDSIIKAKSRKYNIPWRWIKAIAMNESSLGTIESVAIGLANPSDIEGSKSSDGKSWGIMQTILTTSREMVGAPITEKYLNIPENSFEVGVRYLSKNYVRFGGDREKTVRSYNGGPGFMNTVQGRTVTPIYYSRFLANLAVIMSKQPGDELEIG